MTVDEIRSTVAGEYKKRYPDWTDVNVTDVILNVFDGDLAVVRARTPSENEELRFCDHKTGVRIFPTTEELARFIENKANAPLLENARRKTNSGVAIGGLLALILIVVALWNRVDPEVVKRNLATIGGLPFAFITAFAIVALFRQAETPLDFDGFGLKMKGAAGEIMLWVICFVAISGSIALLWKP
jgi:hypothetical protein